MYQRFAIRDPRRAFAARLTGVLSRPFLALLLAIFVATMGISMVSPLLPTYAKELGASKQILGLTFSSFAIVQAIVGPFVGRLSDKWPRKPFIIGGLLIYMVAALGYLTADSVYQVIAFRALSGLGTSAIFSVARAYVGDMTPPGHEGRWIGVFSTADIIGFGSGPLVAGIIRDFFGFKPVFVTMAVMMALSAFIVLWWLPRNAPRDASARRGSDPQVGFLDALRQRLVAAIILNTAIISLAAGASFSFLALRLDEDIGASALLIGLALSTQDITAGICQPLFGVLADRKDRRLLVAAGVSSLGFLMFAMGAVNVYWLVLIIMLAMGAANSLANASGGAIQVVAGRKVGMGTLLGLSSMANGFGIVVGSLVGGQLADRFDTSAAFYFAGVAILIGTVVFLTLTAGVSVRDERLLERPLLELPERELVPAGGQ